MAEKLTKGVIVRIDPVTLAKLKVICNNLNINQSQFFRNIINMSFDNNGWDLEQSIKEIFAEKERENNKLLEMINANKNKGE